jgi:hypothetical protein
MEAKEAGTAQLVSPAVDAELRNHMWLRRLRRLIGTFYLLAQKLVFHNSELVKSTTAPPFMI